MSLVDPDAQGEVVRANDPGKTVGEGKAVNEAVRNAESSGLFSLSEIAFDREHRYAVVSYRYWCGALCGDGAAFVFQKIASEWKNTNRNCGGWIS